MNQWDKSRARRRPSPGGFTLVELLVCIAIIGILIALLLPAISACREAVRRTQCMHNLAQLMVAVSNYEMAHGVYPAGVVDDKGPILSQATGYHHSWTTALLPYIEQTAADRQVDRSVGVYHDNNRAVRSAKLAVLVCPSDDVAGPASSYCGMHHDVEAPIDVTNNGVFFLNSRLSHDEVRDGLSYTVFLSEKLFEPGDLGWMSGTRATLRNVGPGVNVTGLAPPPPLEDLEASGGMYAAMPSEYELAEAAKAARARQKNPPPLPLTFVGGPASRHPGGAGFASGDGSVHWISVTVDQKLLASLVHRADQRRVDVSWW